MLCRASGTSLVAYWTSNLLWDLFIGFLQILALCIGLACADLTDFGGTHFFVIFGLGLLFTINAVCRFYFLSNMITDIKMAQTFLMQIFPCHCVRLLKVRNNSFK